MKIGSAAAGNATRFTRMMNFGAADANGDGYLTVAELKAYLRRQKDSPVTQTMRNAPPAEAIVAELDVDGDGRLSRDETYGMAFRRTKTVRRTLDATA